MMGEGTDRAIGIASAAAPVALALIAYANAIDHGFVLDDTVIVERWLPSMNTFSSLLRPPPNLEFAGVYYRPVTFATMHFDSWLGGGRAWAFHLGTVLLHAVATLLVFAFARSLGLGRLAAVLGASLFAVHPIHTESVAWMAGRTDVLSCIFVLATALTLWSGTGMPSLLASALSLFLGLLAKESSLAGALVLPIGAYLLDKSSPRRAWLVLVSALLPYLGLRAATSFFDASRPTPPLELADVGAFLGLYASKLVWPQPLNGVILEVRPVWLYVALSIATAVVYLALLLRRGGAPLERVLLLFIGMTLAPAIVPVIYRVASTPFAERYLYLPSVGFCLLVAHWLVGDETRRRVPAMVGAAIGTALVGAGLWLTLARNPAWASDLSFWRAQVEVEPGHWRPLLNVGKMLADQGDVAQAEEVYMRVLPLADDEAVPLLLNNLGSIYNATGRADQARDSWIRAAAADPSYPDPLYNLGVFYWSQGQAAKMREDQGAAEEALAKARVYLTRALAVQPLLAPAHYALGSLGFMTGDMELARVHLAETVRLAPASREADAARQVMQMLE